MTAWQKLRILAVLGVVAGTANVATPAWAMLDTPARPAAFGWLEETVYRPDSPSAVHDRGWSSDGMCDGKFCR